jgi:putative selenate reductase
VLSAIGELVEYDLLTTNGIEVDERGNIAIDSNNETNLENVFITGDAFRGPASVVEAIADARKAADGIMAKEEIVQPRITIPQASFDRKIQNKAVRAKTALITPRLLVQDFDEKFRAEADRCLECNYLCNKCVEVCPNRANIEILVDSPLFRDQNQILHLDALCNECGNCGTFCPYQGTPYQDKFTLFWDEQAFLDSDNEGYLPLPDDGVRIRYQGEILELKYENGHLNAPEKFREDDQLKGVFEIMLTVRDRYAYMLPVE